jgi:hypothetical protein
MFRRLVISLSLLFSLSSFAGEKRVVDQGCKAVAIKVNKYLLNLNGFKDFGVLQVSVEKKTDEYGEKLEIYEFQNVIEDGTVRSEVQVHNNGVGSPHRCLISSTHYGNL